MTRNFIILLLLFFTMELHAQTEHMKFADIPLTGTIDQFQKKLIAKGFRLQTDINRQLPAGTRAFKGIFAGRKGNVAVYYDSTTKIVYSAKVYFDTLTSDFAKTELDNLKSLLSVKYGNDNITDGIDTAGNATNTVSTGLGTIFCYTLEDASETGSPYVWSTHAEFSDKANSMMHESVILNYF